MTPNVKSKSQLCRSNISRAKALWPTLCSKFMLKVLRELTTTFGFSIGSGELRIIDGRWYVTHSGLLRLANRRLCKSIQVVPVVQFSDPINNRWVFKSTVHKSHHSRGFVGFGDADPSNVSPQVRGAEMRIAETRAVNRALRKAYGIGLCSVEELGYLSLPTNSETPKSSALPKSNGNGSSNGQPRLRDRLCLLIREHQLDASLVKRYAADFCGTDQLRSASRALVESYIAHLSEWAIRDHTGLVAKLENYSASEQVHS